MSKSAHYTRRHYEFVTTEEYHGKPTVLIPSRAVWHGFEDQTTAHGISHLRHARGPIKTIFWLIASLVSCGLLVYYAYFLFDKFFSYPVNVRVEAISQREMAFPAVTVCNHNAVRKDKVQDVENPGWRELFGYAVDDVTTDNHITTGGVPSVVATTPAAAPVAPEPPPVDSPDSIVETTAQNALNDVTTTASSDDEYGNGAGFMPGAGQTPDGRPVRQEFENYVRLQETLAGMSVENRRDVGYQREDFILDCEYSGGFCYSSDFEEVYQSSAYGNCFTFNLGKNNTFSDSEELYSYRPGPRYGLAITFNIDQDNYVGEFGQEAGVRVVIHAQHRMPFPEDEGISISPGQLTYAGIKLFTVERLGSPHGECLKIKHRNKTRNVYEELYGVKYSATACYKTCYQRNVINRCDCADAQYPTSGEAFGSAQASVCSITDSDQHACMVAVELEFQKGQLECDCPTACTESTYTVTTSTVAWPSEDYKRSLFEQLASENEGIRRVLNSWDDPDKYQKNLAKVVIYFEEFNYETVTEFAAYQSFNFVSDIGGILGLFVGFSVMTIAEFMELGIDLLVLNVIKKCCKRQHGSRVQSATSTVSHDSEPDMKKPYPPAYSRAVTPSFIDLNRHK